MCRTIKDLHKEMVEVLYQENSESSVLITSPLA